MIGLVSFAEGVGVVGGAVLVAALFLGAAVWDERRKR